MTRTELALNLNWLDSISCNIYIYIYIYICINIDIYGSNIFVGSKTRNMFAVVCGAVLPRFCSRTRVVLPNRADPVVEPANMFWAFKPKNMFWVLEPMYKKTYIQYTNYESILYISETLGKMKTGIYIINKKYKIAICNSPQYFRIVGFFWKKKNN